MKDARNGDGEHSTPRQQDVAVYLDFENLYVSLKTTAKMDPNFDLLMEKCREFGRVVLARSYADWSEFARMFTSQMFANGFEPVYVPTRKVYDGRTRSEARKNSVDIQITIDIIKSLYVYEHVDTIILISGDRDYVPLISQIRQQGKSVYAIGVAGCTSGELSTAVDEMFFYHQLLDSGEEKEERQLDVYNQLVRALRIARRRGYPATLGIVKPIMKELIEGFHERNYKNGRGQAFTKFKDLVLEAQRRRLVKLVSERGMTEVFVWAEAPKTAAQEGREGRDGRGRRDDAGSGRSSRGGRRRGGRRAETDTHDAHDAHDAHDESTREAGATADRHDEGQPIAADAPGEDGREESTERRPRSRGRRRSSRSRSTAEPTPTPAAAAAGDADDDAVEAETGEVAADDGQAAKPGVASPAGIATDPGSDATEPDAAGAESSLAVTDITWQIVADAVETFGDKPPTPRKLMNQLKKARTAKAFGDPRPSDADLDDLIRQCVDAGKLRRERKGFSTILRMADSGAVEVSPQA